MEPTEYNSVLEYFKNLHPEDRPQEIYEILDECTETPREAEELAEHILEVAGYVVENEDQ